MKITTSQSEYTIDESEIINDSLSHCDICNDIAGMHVENADEEKERYPENVDADFVAVLEYATKHLPEAGTFADWDALCARAQS